VTSSEDTEKLTCTDPQQETVSKEPTNVEKALEKCKAVNAQKKVILLKLTLKFNPKMSTACEELL